MSRPPAVIPANAGTHRRNALALFAMIAAQAAITPAVRAADEWVPAFAGMTV